MDRWWTRLFNRYRGTLVPEPTRQGLDRFRELIGHPEFSDADVIAATIPYRKAYHAQGYKNGTEIEKAANTIYKAAFEELIDEPKGGGDRRFMIEAAEEAQRMLRRQGHELAIDDIQAVLWYYEKRLYGEFTGRPTPDISYEEAAKTVVEERAGRSPAGDGGPGRPGPELVREPAAPGAVGAAGPVDGRLRRGAEGEGAARDEPGGAPPGLGPGGPETLYQPAYHGSPHRFNRFDSPRPTLPHR
jgi:hypothetical protein